MAFAAAFSWAAFWRSSARSAAAAFFAALRSALACSLLPSAGDDVSAGCASGVGSTSAFRAGKSADDSIGTGEGEDETEGVTKSEVGERTDG